MAGSRPYNRRLCAKYQLDPGAHIYNSAYCHPIVTTPSLWLWAIGWAMAALVAGFFLFWRAETRYGRG
jgi:hypothetical protein